ncbi:MAG: PDZ domain-containing protein [Candidatus Omnitrophota bacterium]|nr:PDZ domain-containing protein [Candidatus Omnitrophota bacterium]
MINKKSYLLSAVFFICGLWTVDRGLSDTIYTKDGKELKGIIVEDYKDRIIFSTVDGQLTLMKSDVKELYFDTEDQNLISLAEQSKDNGDYIKAFAYYDKAFKMNPGSKAAKDGIVFLQGYLFKRDMSQKEEVVRRHNEFERKVEAAGIKSEEDKFSDDLKKLQSEAGMTLETKDGMTDVESARIGSSAYEAGIRRGDTLVAVWGRLVGYMSLREVVETLLEKNSLETKITLERGIDVSVSPDDPIGATLTMRLEGLTVSAVKEGSSAYEAGLMPEDLIIKINGNLTRYMPLKKAMEAIKRSKGGKVSLIIRKEIVMWGKGGV